MRTTYKMERIAEKPQNSLPGKLIFSHYAATVEKNDQHNDDAENDHTEAAAHKRYIHMQIRYLVIKKTQPPLAGGNIKKAADN